ncbi:class I SAM-dependent methyltransferase [Actinoplanes bogorensis]|uniref:Class I SAM-dependent methyltransferase n=1 Tax=Paractinoplanes bogorensis TaxID=1610840 RepID=A0ABS5YI64_9ACTN|nr:class I SAM-dependent methyltransferase [Actinoplanes bogorensis]MBU2662433.1 class I SAM-dependent methyltransferase [Actinoplanes bogorensis]
MPTPHRERRTAESFGVDPARYDRARPAYPAALISRLVAAAPGPSFLDVGLGTGILARQLRAAGARVLGVEPDPRMAGFARAGGFEVEVARFEDWDPAGRSFDAVVAGQAWHWVDPVAGAAVAASVLRPGGRLALVWNAAQPSADAGEAFAEVFRRLLPDSPLANLPNVTAAQGYASFLDQADGGLRRTGAFAEPERWASEWDHVYTRDDWLDQLPTQGLFTTLPADRLAELVAAIGAAVDDLGGSFPMHFTTLTTTAVRA